MLFPESIRNKKDLNFEQINGLRNIGLIVVPENERDPIMEPKSFEDYVLLLKEMQKFKDKTGRDINSVKREEVVRITKINDECNLGISQKRVEESHSWQYSSLAEKIMDYFNYMKVDEGLGRKITTIENANLRCWFSDEVCTLEEAQMNFSRPF